MSEGGHGFLVPRSSELWKFAGVGLWSYEALAPLLGGIAGVLEGNLKKTFQPSSSALAALRP